MTQCADHVTIFDKKRLGELVRIVATKFSLIRRKQQTRTCSGQGSPRNKPATEKHNIYVRIYISAISLLVVLRFLSTLTRPIKPGRSPNLPRAHVGGELNI
jgi:hypothetical protein